MWPFIHDLGSGEMTHATTERVLITGAGGNMGHAQDQAGHSWADPQAAESVPCPARRAPAEAVETVSASVTDFAAVLAACEGVDAIIHLGGLSGEAPFEDILHTNVQGSQYVLEAAHRQGVRKVLLASSNHAVGYFTRDDAPADGLPADLPPRPDSYYGWSKTATESIGPVVRRHPRDGRVLPADRIVLPRSHRRPASVDLAVTRRQRETDERLFAHRQRRVSPDLGGVREYPSMVVAQGRRTDRIPPGR